LWEQRDFLWFVLLIVAVLLFSTLLSSRASALVGSTFSQKHKEFRTSPAPLNELPASGDNE